MVLEGGTISYSVHLSTEANDHLFDETCRYQQRRAWRYKRSFSQHRFGTGYKPYSVEITPETDWVSAQASQHEGGLLLTQLKIFPIWWRNQVNGRETSSVTAAAALVGGLTGAAAGAHV